MTIPNDVSLQGFSSADWARSIYTTLCDTQRETLEAYGRNQKMFTMIRQKGNIETGVSGRGNIMAVQMAIDDLVPTSPTAGRTFQARNLWRNAAYEYREAEVTQFLYDRELRENRGTPALVKLASGMADRLERAWSQKINPLCYVDGDAEGNQESFHGLHSFLGLAVDGSGIAVGYEHDATTVTERAVTHANKLKLLVMKPDDRYCSLSTKPHQYGGSLESGNNYAVGRCAPEGDFWSPVMINTRTNKFGDVPTTGTPWGMYAPELIRFGLQMNRRNSADAHVDTVFLDREMMTELQNLLAHKERTQVTRTNGLRSFGFIDILEFDQVEFTTEYDVGLKTVQKRDGTNDAQVPCAIGIPSNKCSFKSMNDELVEWGKPFKDPDARGTKFYGNTSGNFFWGSPRCYLAWFEAVAA